MVSMVSALLLAGCATNQRGPTEWDGLIRQPDTRLGAVFIKPDAEIPAYTSVMLSEVQVQFSRHWEPNRGTRSVSRRLNPDDLAAIKSGLAELFHEIFAAELGAGGYEIVTQPGPDTLLVIPSIVDLYINAPDTASGGRNRTYTANTGQMTLVMELRDSVTGETLARVVDTQSGRSFGMLTIANRVTNTADARQAIRTWAQALRRGLDSLHADQP